MRQLHFFNVKFPIVSSYYDCLFRMTILSLQRSTKGEEIHGNKSGYWSKTLKRLCGMEWTESLGRMSAEQNLREEKQLV